MFLTCPSCYTRFSVPDGAIPPSGRMVRCANCKASWRATPDQLEQDEPLPPPPAAPPPPAVPVPAAAPAAGGIAGHPPIAESAESQAAPMAKPDDMARIRAMLDDDLTPDEPEGADDAPPSFDDDPLDDDRPGLDVSRMFAEEDEAPGADAGADGSDDLDDDDELSDSGADTLVGGLHRLAAQLRDDGDATGDADGDFDMDGLVSDDDDFLARRRGEQRRLAERDAAGRKRRIVTALWALLLLFWVAVGYVLIAHGETVRTVWPASSVLYESLAGLRDVDRYREGAETLTPPLAEAPEIVTAALTRSRLEVIDGVDTLIIEGYVENRGRAAASVPKVRVDVLDAAGASVDNWVFDPPGLVIRRGMQLEFTTTRTPVPDGAASATVAVLEGSRSETEAAPR